MRVGVVVGRFQVDELHIGHRGLIDFAKTGNDIVVVVLGVNEVKGGKKNPLDFMTRKVMIEQTYDAYTELVVLPLHDHPSDEVWSKNLDKLLEDIFPGAMFSLYAGRDSFAEHYTGKLAIHKVIENQNCSATDNRKKIGNTVLHTADFRRGIIYGAMNNWPRLFMCVDVAAVTPEFIIVGQRAGEEKCRFFGGFVDQSDPNLEVAALREIREEANLLPLTIEYLSSHKVEDYRYHHPDEGLVMTSLMLARIAEREPKPEAGDDIDMIFYLDRKQEPLQLVSEMIPSHQPLMRSLLTRLAKDKR